VNAETIELYPAATRAVDAAARLGGAGVPRAAVELVTPLEVEDGCQRCRIGQAKQCRNPVRAEAFGPEDAETLLVVDDWPSAMEDVEGRPLLGRIGAKLRPLLRKGWAGRIVLVPALRCHPGRGDKGVMPGDHEAEACRSHLAHTIAEVQPDRILALGSFAAGVLLGRHFNPITARRAYAWLWNNGEPVPVFPLIDTTQAGRNKFLWRYLEDDLAWALQAKVQMRHAGAVANVITTPAEAREAAELLRNSPDGFAFDLEWAGFQYDPDLRIICFSAAPLGGGPVLQWDAEGLGDPGRWEPLKAVLEDPDVPKGGSNIKSDMHTLLSAKGTRVKGISFDVRLQRKILDADSPGDLDNMADLVGMGGHKDENATQLDAITLRIVRMAAQAEKKRAELAARTGNHGFDFELEVDTEAAHGFDPEKYGAAPMAIAHAFVPRVDELRYNARDTLTTARLAPQLALRLAREPERARVWEEIVLPASLAVQRIEEWGVPYDRQAGALFRGLMESERDDAFMQVQKYGKINPDSPQQLGQLLYGTLGLKPPHQTESGADSTDEEALSALRGQHPLPGHILDFRHYRRLVNSTKDWDRCWRPDGCVHPSVQLDGARSGRTSCSDPNMQNVDRAETEDGKRARDCFVAPRGHVFFELDYSQLELRVAAYLARDMVMAELFKSGVDFHLGTAKLISKIAWGLEPDLVGDIHRQAAKPINFALAYGKSVKTLARELNIPVEQAQKIVDAILGAFKKFAKWSRDAVGFAREHGGCWTWWADQRARWRPLWRIASEGEEDGWAASNARNGAINTPVQGTASDFCVASLGRCVQAIERGDINAKLILPIHDSLMFCAPEATWKDQALAAQAVMTDYPWCTNVVPLKVDCKVGMRWGSLQKVKLAA